MKKHYKVSACALSNIGKTRVNHEDNFLLDDGQYINEFEQKNIININNPWHQNVEKIYAESITNTTVFAISDGMGGHSAGEIASRIVVEQLNAKKTSIFRDSDVNRLIGRIQDFVIQTNKLIVELSEANNSLKGMGATLTGLILSNEQCIVFNIGDSRTYRFDQSKLIQITKDHTEAQRLVEFGLIDKSQVSLVENGKAITRYFGLNNSHMIPEVETFVLPITEKSWFLICSDGLTDIVSDESINTILLKYFSSGDLQSASKELVEMALSGNNKKKGGIDNITVILVEIDVANIVYRITKRLNRIKF